MTIENPQNPAHSTVPRTQQSINAAAPGTTTIEPRRSRVRHTPPLPEAMRRTTADLAQQFSDQHGKLDPETADRIGRLFRAGIVQHKRRGKRISVPVAKALRLVRMGIKWSKIYPHVIPNFKSLPYLERMHHAMRLRHAVRPHLRKAENQRFIS